MSWSQPFQLSQLFQCLQKGPNSAPVVGGFACFHMLFSGHSEIKWRTVVRPLSAWAATLDCRPSVICSTPLSSTACQCAATCPAHVCSVHQPHFRNSSERAGREAVNDQASVRCTCSTLGLAREVQTFLSTGKVLGKAVQGGQKCCPA